METDKNTAEPFSLKRRIEWQPTEGFDAEELSTLSQQAKILGEQCSTNITVDDLIGSSLRAPENNHALPPDVSEMIRHRFGAVITEKTAALEKLGQNLVTSWAWFELMPALRALEQEEGWKQPMQEAIASMPPVLASMHDKYAAMNAGVHATSPLRRLQDSQFFWNELLIPQNLAVIIRAAASGKKDAAELQQMEMGLHHVRANVRWDFNRNRTIYLLLTEPVVPRVHERGVRTYILGQWDPHGDLATINLDRIAIAAEKETDESSHVKAMRRFDAQLKPSHDIEADAMKRLDPFRQRFFKCLVDIVACEEMKHAVNRCRFDREYMASLHDKSEWPDLLKLRSMFTERRLGNGVVRKQLWNPSTTQDPTELSDRIQDVEEVNAKLWTAAVSPSPHLTLLFDSVAVGSDHEIGRQVRAAFAALQETLYGTQTKEPKEFLDDLEALPEQELRLALAKTIRREFADEGNEHPFCRISQEGELVRSWKTHPYFVWNDDCIRSWFARFRKQAL